MICDHQRDFMDLVLIQHILSLQFKVIIDQTSRCHHLLPQEASAIGLLLQPLPQRVSVRSVHIDLTEHVVLSVVGLCKLLDLSVSTRLLQNKTNIMRVLISVTI